MARLDVADTWWTRLVGLMMRRSIPADAGLLIDPCRSIHMMFMRFPIDAIFIDREGRVTRVARHVRPWTGLAFGGRGARAVIEVAAGAAEGVEAGEELSFEDGAAEPKPHRT